MNPQASWGDGITVPGGTERLQLIQNFSTTGATEGPGQLNVREQTLATIITRGLAKATQQGIDYVVVLMVPLIIFCVLSWSLSLPGAGEWLALIGMAIIAVFRILCINR